MPSTIATKLAVSFAWLFVVCCWVTICLPIGAKAYSAPEIFIVVSANNTTTNASRTSMSVRFLLRCSLWRGVMGMAINNIQIVALYLLTQG
jgi:hypothetical protein